MNRGLLFLCSVLVTIHASSSDPTCPLFGINSAVFNQQPQPEIGAANPNCLAFRNYSCCETPQPIGLSPLGLRITNSFRTRYNSWLSPPSDPCEAALADFLCGFSCAPSQSVFLSASGGWTASICDGLCQTLYTACSTQVLIPENDTVANLFTFSSFCARLAPVSWAFTSTPDDEFCLATAPPTVTDLVCSTIGVDRICVKVAQDDCATMSYTAYRNGASLGTQLASLEATVTGVQDIEWGLTTNCVYLQTSADYLSRWAMTGRQNISFSATCNFLEAAASARAQRWYINLPPLNCAICSPINPCQANEVCQPNGNPSQPASWCLPLCQVINCAYNEVCNPNGIYADSTTWCQNICDAQPCFANQICNRSAPATARDCDSICSFNACQQGTTCNPSGQGANPSTWCSCQQGYVGPVQTSLSPPSFMCDASFCNVSSAPETLARAVPTTNIRLLQGEIRYFSVPIVASTAWWRLELATSGPSNLAIDYTMGQSCPNPLAPTVNSVFATGNGLRQDLVGQGDSNSEDCPAFGAIQATTYQLVLFCPRQALGTAVCIVELSFDYGICHAIVAQTEALPFFQNDATDLGLLIFGILIVLIGFIVFGVSRRNAPG